LSVKLIIFPTRGAFLAFPWRGGNFLGLFGGLTTKRVAKFGS
jgi:hypothetical protein